MDGRSEWSSGGPSVGRRVRPAVGILAIAAGVTLMLRPFASLGALTIVVGVGLILAGGGELLEDVPAVTGGRPGSSVGC